MAEPRSESGTGVVGSIAGVLVFLSLMLLASQVLASLYARSTVSAAGFDAARSVASRRVDHHDPAQVAAAESSAEDELRALLGPLADGATFTWDVGSTSVRLRIQVDSPAFVPSSMIRGLGTRRIDRTFDVRIEDLR